MKNRSHIILRYIIMGVFIAIFAGKIGYNLVQTTVIHSEDWNKLAMKELSQTVTITPVRGKLLATDGRVLAANRRLYNVRVDFTSEQFRFKNYREALSSLADSMAAYFPENNRDKWLERLNEPLNLHAQLGHDAAKDKQLKRTLRSWLLLGKVESKDVDRLSSFPFFDIGNSAKTGLVVEPTDVRFKPFGPLAARSIGIVAQDSTSSERHGRSGLEGSLDSLLYGIPGVAKKVPLTKHIGNWTDVPAIPGYDVTTTIDIDIQDIVETELLRMLKENQSEWGSAILMEVSTGDIRAISNFERDKKGRYDVCINRIFAPYEPGSVMKPISMLIALEQGIVKSLNQTFPGHGGRWNFPSAAHPIYDSHKMGNVPVDLILPYSSNIGTAEMIMSRWGDNPGGFSEQLAAIGLREPLNIGIMGEQMPRFKMNPSKVDLSRMAYGYTTAIPPIYTLTVFNAIANDGKMVRPRLYSRLERLDTVIDLPITYVRDQVCTPEHAKMLRKMLREVVTKPSATANVVLNSCPIPLAGKTGTCYLIENGRYVDTKKRVAFCGYFPADNPKYSCFVFMEWPKVKYVGAASASGQVLKNIALKLHARGMLGNSSDYTLDTRPDTKPELAALPAGSFNDYSSLIADLSLKQASIEATPTASGAGCVPDVRGLTLRYAVKELEDAGYNVSVSGEGSVVSQTPEAGSSVPAGSNVRITLATNINGADKSTDNNKKTR